MHLLGSLAIVLLLAGCASTAPSGEEVASETQTSRPDPNDAVVNPAPEESPASPEPAESSPAASEPAESPEPSETSEAASTAKPTATAKPTTTAKPTASPKPTPEPTVTAGPVFVSKAEVAKNNSRSSCWVIIDGSVYDLTKWIAQHPGGASAILNLCGGDGTQAFSSTHGGEARPSSVLQNYFFAELEK